jgi:hypothetical protein
MIRTYTIGTNAAPFLAGLPTCARSSLKRLPQLPLMHLFQSYHQPTFYDSSASYYYTCYRAGNEGRLRWRWGMIGLTESAEKKGATGAKRFSPICQPIPRYASAITNLRIKMKIDSSVVGTNLAEGATSLCRHQSSHHHNSRPHGALHLPSPHCGQESGVSKCQYHTKGMLTADTFVFVCKLARGECFVRCVSSANLSRVEQARGAVEVL